MLIIGTIIGAGFASGRELISFFGSAIPPFTALVCALIIFGLSFVFLYIGSKIGESGISAVNRRLAGKAHLILDIFLLVNNFIVLAGMLAGIDSLGGMFLNIAPAYSVISGALSIFVVCKGIKGLLDCNKIVVPVIIVALILICAFTIRPQGFDGGAFVGKTLGISVIYICMNMMLAGTILTTVGGLDNKTIALSSALAAILMGTLIALIVLALNNSGYSSFDMPLMALAKQISPFVFGLIAIVIAISIFTTMLTAMSGLVSWFEPMFKSKFFASIVVLIGGFAVSNLGFSNVVSYLYPVIGVIGLFYALSGIIFVLKNAALFKARGALFKHRNAQIHQRGKNAKNEN